MNPQARRPVDPLTFFLLCAVVVSMAALLSSFLYGLLQLMALEIPNGRAAALVTKLRNLLPPVLWAGLAASAGLSFMGWWRCRSGLRGGGQLFIGLVGLLGLCLANTLHVRSLGLSLHAAQQDSKDVRDATREQMDFINADIAQQREAIRGELAESDQIRAQVSRTLARLRLDDSPFTDLDALMEQIQKLSRSTSGASLDAGQVNTIHRELARIMGASDPVERGELHSKVTHGDRVARRVRIMLDRLSLQEGGYPGSAALMEDLQKLHNATADGMMSYPEMVTVEREFKRLYCEDKNGKRPGLRPIPTPLPTPKAGPRYGSIVPTPRPKPTATPRPAVPENVPGKPYANADMGFSTRFPEGWRVTEDTAAGMVIASQPIRNPRDPVRSSIAVLKLDRKGSVEELRDSYLEEFQRDAEGFEELERGMMPMRAGQAAFVRCAYKEMGKKRQCIQITIPRPDGSAYLLNMSSAFDGFDALRQEFMITSVFFVVD